MPESTPNYNLAKPSLTDAYDVGVQNINMDKIDAALADKADLIDGRIDTGQMPINVVPIATTSGSGSTYTANIEGNNRPQQGPVINCNPAYIKYIAKPCAERKCAGCQDDIQTYIKQYGVRQRRKHQRMAYTWRTLAGAV